MHGVFSYLVITIAKLFAEEERSAPQTCKADDGVNDPAEYGILSTKQPGHKIKLKDTDEAPVDTANDRQDQSKCIDHDLLPPFLYWLMISFPEMREIYFQIDGRSVLGYNMD